MSERERHDRSKASLYKVRPADWALRPMMNRRRSVISPVVFMDVPTHHWAAEEMLTAEGLGDYAHSAVVEAYNRPIVEASFEDDYVDGFRVYEKHFPYLLQWMMEHAQLKPYSFNKDSRLGAPYCARVESKRDLLIPQFRKLLLQGEAGMLAYVQPLFTLINIRLQTEKKSRVRQFTFVNADGQVYEQAIGYAERMVHLKRWGMDVAALRTRTIFNPPVLNLLLLMLDQSLHGALLDTVACGHNLFAAIQDVLPRVAKAYVFTDLRHMDRHTGRCARFRAAQIGGIYEAVFNAMFDLPYLVPSDDWSENLWVTVLGVPQFPSGFSCVANLQKEYLICLYVDFVMQYFGLTQAAAFDFVLGGGDTRMVIRNYGDDNALAGEPAVLDAWMQYARGKCDIEIEDPPKFLGFIWDYGKGKFFLTAQSYLLKTWLNEREPKSGFRPRPCLGWKLKRETYERFGYTEQMKLLYDREDRLLAKYGVPWQRVLEEAARESEAAFGETGIGYAAMNKEYLLTDLERSKLPGFEAVEPAIVREFALRLVGPQHRDTLSRAFSRIHAITLAA